MIPSVFESEQELLKSIIALHSPSGIELDPMYFKGNFYKEIARPRLIYDIEPQMPECKHGDARSLPILACSVNSLVLDPPFMFGIHGKTKEYYSSRTHGIMKDFSELENLYKLIIAEAWRVLKSNGIMFFKCQDYTDNISTMVHCYVWQWAQDAGFYPKDLAILHLPKNKVFNPYLTQRHMRKMHSYFWVFKKRAHK
jgi:DNA modification methylase